MEATQPTVPTPRTDTVPTQGTPSTQVEQHVQKEPAFDLSQWVGGFGKPPYGSFVPTTTHAFTRGERASIYKALRLLETEHRITLDETLTKLKYYMRDAPSDPYEQEYWREV